MSPTDDVVDMTELMEIMDNDMDLTRECFQDFLEDCPEMLADIQAAIDGGDAASLDRSAHKLKGSLRYLAAFPAADQAYVLEKLGKENGMQGAPAAFDSLRDECRRLKRFIEGYLHR